MDQRLQLLWGPLSQSQHSHSVWSKVSWSTPGANAVGRRLPRSVVIRIQRTRNRARDVQKWQVFGRQTVVLVPSSFRNIVKDV